jgi:hypothetical protein
MRSPSPLIERERAFELLPGGFRLAGLQQHAAERAACAGLARSMPLVLQFVHRALAGAARLGQTAQLQQWLGQVAAQHAAQVGQALRLAQRQRLFEARQRLLRPAQILQIDAQVVQHRHGVARGATREEQRQRLLVKLQAALGLAGARQRHPAGGQGLGQQVRVGGPLRQLQGAVGPGQRGVGLAELRLRHRQAACHRELQGRFGLRLRRLVGLHQQRQPGRRLSLVDLGQAAHPCQLHGRSGGRAGAERARQSVEFGQGLDGAHHRLLREALDGGVEGGLGLRHGPRDCCAALFPLPPPRV